MTPGANTLTHLTAADQQAIASIYGTHAQAAEQDASWSWNATTDTLTQVLKAGGQTVRGISTNNVITGGSGNDTIYAIGAGTNTVNGKKGDDTLVGGSGVSYLDGGAGADILNGWFGTSYAVYGDAPAGVLVSLLNPSANTGDAAGDSYLLIHDVKGSKYADTIVGDNSGDKLYGLGGNDTITGGTGKDTISGGAGQDVLTGGAGADKFVYGAPGEGGDTITDFSHAQGDTILISHKGFGGGLPASGALSANEFVAGTAATAALGQFLWDASSHLLAWDSDGTGPNAPVTIATLTGVSTLTASDIHLN